MGASAVTLVDISEGRIRAGRSICPDFEFIDNSADSLEKRIGNRKFSLTIEGTGSPSRYSLAIEYADNNGRVLFLGNPAGDVVLKRAVVSKILRKRLSIHGTWNSTVGGPVNEWQVTLDAIASGDLKLNGLITHRFALDEVGTALEMMRDNKEFFNRVMIEC